VAMFASEGARAGVHTGVGTGGGFPRGGNLLPFDAGQAILMIAKVRPWGHRLPGGPLREASCARVIRGW
jgi:hypothetical protein